MVHLSRETHGQQEIPAAQLKGEFHRPIIMYNYLIYIMLHMRNKCKVTDRQGNAQQCDRNADLQIFDIIESYIIGFSLLADQQICDRSEHGKVTCKSADNG